MADKKISQLTGATTPLAGTEVLPIVQGGNTVKVSVANLTAGRTVDATTVNATTVDATNVEVTNIKAKDGTAAITVSDSSGFVGVGTNSPGQRFVVSGGRSLFGSTGENLAVGVGYNGTRVAAGEVYYVGATNAGLPNLIFSNAYGEAKVAITHNGNLAVGSAGNAWIDSWRAIDMPGGSLVGSSVQQWVSQNLYLDSSAVQRYVSSAPASFYRQYDGEHDFITAPTGTAGDPVSSTVKMRLTQPGNLKLGGFANRATTEGTAQLVLFNGTAPAGTLSNGISLYSSSGEAYVMDAAGNATLISPHDSQTNEWIFKSKHTPTGKVLRIDVEKLLRFVNDHFGLDAVKEFVEE